MTKKMYTHITIVSFIIGFMLAVQYNTVQSPADERDTRDLGQIRQELAEEGKIYSELLVSIRNLEETVDKYEDESETNPAAVLAETVNQLQQQAGNTEITGPGLILSIKPAEELVIMGYEIEPISPFLLIRLVNDMNRFNATHIEIDGQRIGFTTAIRDLNGRTSVNGLAINDSEIEIRVLTDTEEQAEKLYNHLLASTFRDEFYIDNLTLDIQEVVPSLTIQSTIDLPQFTQLREKEES